MMDILYRPAPASKRNPSLRLGVSHRPLHRRLNHLSSALNVKFEVELNLRPAAEFFFARGSTHQEQRQAF
jgi:hypothetical protein